jgi:hypothetical protein
MPAQRYKNAMVTHNWPLDVLLVPAGQERIVGDDSVILSVVSPLVGKHVGVRECRLVRNSPSTHAMIKQRGPIAAIKSVNQSDLPSESQRNRHNRVQHAFPPEMGHDHVG